MHKVSVYLLVSIALAAGARADHFKTNSKVAKSAFELSDCENLIFNDLPGFKGLFNIKSGANGGIDLFMKTAGDFHLDTSVPGPDADHPASVSDTAKNGEENHTQVFFKYAHKKISEITFYRDDRQTNLNPEYFVYSLRVNEQGNECVLINKTVIENSPRDINNKKLGFERRTSPLFNAWSCENFVKFRKSHHCFDNCSLIQPKNEDDKGMSRAAFTQKYAGKLMTADAFSFASPLKPGECFEECSNEDLRSQDDALYRAAGKECPNRSEYIRAYMNSHPVEGTPKGASLPESQGAKIAR